MTLQAKRDIAWRAATAEVDDLLFRGKLEQFAKDAGNWPQDDDGNDILPPPEALAEWALDLLYWQYQNESGEN